MEYLMNNAKYSDRTLSDEEIDHRVDYSDMHSHSMSELQRNMELDKGDRKAIEDSFEKHFW